jgi:hypothetical protein
MEMLKLTEQQIAGLRNPAWDLYKVSGRLATYFVLEREMFLSRFEAAIPNKLICAAVLERAL